MNINEIKARLTSIFEPRRNAPAGRRCNEDCLGGHTHDADCALRDDHVGKCDSLDYAETP